MIYCPGVDEAVKKLIGGGVKVVMITGDSGNLERKLFIF